MMHDDRWRGIETRATYTEQQVEAAQTAVTTGTLDPSQIAAVQAAAGAWARAFAGAAVMPQNPATRAITPAVLYQMGRAMVLTGEWVWLLDVADGRLSMYQAASWDVHGRLEWRYVVELAGPSGSFTRRVPGASVVHPRINVDPNQPHRGQSSVRLAGYSAALAAYIERGFSQEAGGLRGYALPMQTEGLSTEDLTGLRDDVRGAAGNVVFVPSTAPRAGDPGSGPGRPDWKPNRLGFTPADAEVSLRGDAAVGLLGAAGVPAELFGSGGDGTGRREAFRQFISGSVQPVARIIEHELSVKLDTAVTLDFATLRAADVQGSARAYRALVGAGSEQPGIEDAEARRLSGLA